MSKHKEIKKILNDVRKFCEKYNQQYLSICYLEDEEGDVRVTANGDTDKIGHDDYFEAYVSCRTTK